MGYKTRTEEAVREENEGGEKGRKGGWGYRGSEEERDGRREGGMEGATEGRMGGLRKGGKGGRE